MVFSCNWSDQFSCWTGFQHLWVGYKTVLYYRWYLSSLHCREVWLFYGL